MGNAGRFLLANGDDLRRQAALVFMYHSGERSAFGITQTRKVPVDWYNEAGSRTLTEVDLGRKLLRTQPVTSTFVPGERARDRQDLPFVLIAFSRWHFFVIESSLFESLTFLYFQFLLLLIFLLCYCATGGCSSYLVKCWKFWNFVSFGALFFFQVKWNPFFIIKV